MNVVDVLFFLVTTRPTLAGPIYLFFSVNASGQFCGLAQMESSLDYTTKFGSWGQDKWNGTFKIKWAFPLAQASFNPQNYGKIAGPAVWASLRSECLVTTVSPSLAECEPESGGYPAAKCRNFRVAHR